MEPMYDPSSGQQLPVRQKPMFLKVLCILTFIWSGLLILVYFVGSLLYFISEETAAQVMDQLSQTYPNIEVEDPLGAVQMLAKISFIQMLMNVGSLVGAIMMWNLNRIGFFIYALCEIAANFTGSMNLGVEGSSMAGLIFFLFTDITFIVLYALNLKYMNKNQIRTS